MAQVKDGPNVVKVEGEIYTSFYCRLQIIADNSFFFSFSPSLLFALGFKLIKGHVILRIGIFSCLFTSMAC